MPATNSSTSESRIIQWLNSQDLHSKFQEQGNFLPNLTLKDLELVSNDIVISSPLEDDYYSYVASALYLLEKNYL